MYCSGQLEKNKACRRPVACAGVWLFCLHLLGGCATRQVLTRGEARDALIRLPGMDLPKNDIFIQKIEQLDGNHAVVEADVTAAFRLKRQQGQWFADEIRLAGGRWAKIDSLQQEGQSSRVLTTRQDLLLLALALERYRLQNQKYPEAKQIVALVEILFPRYLSQPVAKDAWGNDFIYHLKDPTYCVILSAGPDGKAGTHDDLSMEGGHLN